MTDEEIAAQIHVMQYDEKRQYYHQSALLAVG